MPLGQLLGALGRFLAGLGRFLNAFFLPGIPRASILEGLGAGRAWFWKASGAYFGVRFAAPRTLKPNAFIHAVTTFFRLQALCILSLPVRRSVRSTWNPSKTPPKSMFQQTCDSSSILARKNLCRRSADIDFVLVFPIRNGSWTIFC